VLDDEGWYLALSLTLLELAALMSNRDIPATNRFSSGHQSLEGRLAAGYRARPKPHDEKAWLRSCCQAHQAASRHGIAGIGWFTSTSVTRLEETATLPKSSTVVQGRSAPQAVSLCVSSLCQVEPGSCRPSHFVEVLRFRSIGRIGPSEADLLVARNEGVLGSSPSVGFKIPCGFARSRRFLLRRACAHFAHTFRARQR
jgi:hypothetical protein